jgi:hypothetical protein
MELAEDSVEWWTCLLVVVNHCVLLPELVNW